VTGKIEIRTGKKRQWIAQIVETPNPNLSQRTEAVKLLSDKLITIGVNFSVYKHTHSWRGYQHMI